MDAKKRNWGFLITSILLVLAGICVMIYPIQSVPFVVFTVAIVIMIRGLFQIIGSKAASQLFGSRGLMIACGILDILFGILLMTDFLSGAVTLVYLLAIWMMSSSILSIAKSFEIKGFGVKNWWLVLLSGILGILCTVFIVMAPLASFIAVNILFGVYMLIYGIIGICEFISA